MSPDSMTLKVNKAIVKIQLQPISDHIKETKDIELIF